RFVVRVWLPEAPAGGGATAGRRVARPRSAASGGGGADGTVSAPMQGTIVKVLVSEGDTVEPAQALLVLEAMKMENHINAELGGTVKEVRVAAGDNVGTGDVLVGIE
ncbi:MAG: biotin/lipoyl-containing protein, partial [Acidimicrobiia bacterium]